MGVAHFLLSLGLVVAAQAQNCPKPVGGENMGFQGNNADTYTNGTSITFTCNVGYTSAGSGTITCISGTWTPLKMTCTKKNCGSAGDIQNGYVDYPEGTFYGAQLVVICNSGYNPVGGSKKIFCRENGWDGRLPSCQVTTCAPPLVIPNGRYNPMSEEPYSYRQSVIYSCDRDYTLNGTKTLTCSEEGVFIPEPPNCVKVECEEPNIKNALWDGGSRAPYGYKSTVIYKCVPGFTMEGEETQICDIDSKWSPGLPTCKFISTTPKPTTTTTTTTTTPATTTTDSSVSTSAKKPTDSKPGPTARPKPDPTPDFGNSSKILTGSLITLAVLAVGILIGCFFYRRNKQQSSQRGYPDNVPAKDAEDVPLS